MQHVATCLSDSPTYNSTPAKGTEYAFVSFENAIPSPYIIAADIESENVDCRQVCGFCDAKLYYLNDKDEMIKVVKDCDHPKESFRSCELCTLKILRLRKDAVAACERNHHTITKEGVDVCDPCQKKLTQKEDSVIHDSTHVLPCNVCPPEESQYCIHSATQKMKSLTPLIYSLVVFDNVKRKVRSTVTYGGANAVQDFFEYLDELRPALEAEHAARAQKFPDVNKIWSRKKIELYKKRNTKCWNCFKGVSFYYVRIHSLP